jgi:hypothetical protein
MTESNYAQYSKQSLIAQYSMDELKAMTTAEYDNVTLEQKMRILKVLNDPDKPNSEKDAARKDVTITSLQARYGECRGGILRMGQIPRTEAVS